MDLENVKYVGQAVLYAGLGVTPVILAWKAKDIIDAFAVYREKRTDAASRAEVARIRQQGEVDRENREHELECKQEYADALEKELRLREHQIDVEKAEMELEKDPDYQKLTEERRRELDELYEKFFRELPISMFYDTRDRQEIALRHAVNYLNAAKGH